MKNLMAILMVVLVLCLCGSAGAATLNVPGDYGTIQDAINVANAGDTVLVAAGLYEENIELKDGVAVIGAGAPETTIDGGGAGSVVTATGCGTDTVLEGFTVTNGNATPGGGMYNYSSSPTVNNCTFASNSADRGGGMYNIYSSPTITNCTFSGNSGHLGGGMLNETGSNPRVTNCTFAGNSADTGGGMDNRQSNPTVTNCTFSGNSARVGGGMYNGISNPTIVNCMFSENSAVWGGGMGSNESSPTVTNCTFSGNLGGLDGGGMNNGSYSSPTVTNCTFSGNSASYGGGMRNFDYSNPTVTNCTFSGNSADDDGGGMLSWGTSNPIVTNCTFSSNSAGIKGGGVSSGNPTLTNCILWGNTAPIGPQIYTWITVSYSDVQDGWPGTGNIDVDPLFIDPADGNLRLMPYSPCIDAGDNTAVPAGVTTDLDGNPRFVDQPEVPDTGNGAGNGKAPIVDMGAYEADYIEVEMKFTSQALNLGSGGQLVKAHFVLPESFSIEDVDVNTPAVVAQFGIESYSLSVLLNDDGLVRVEATFSRSDLCGSITSYDQDIEVMVIGRFTSGRYFYGSGIIKVTDRAFEHLAILVSHWLEGDCSEPDWCGGADLNADSAVNFTDFTLLDSCCIEVIK